MTIHTNKNNKKQRGGLQIDGQQVAPAAPVAPVAPVTSTTTNTVSNSTSSGSSWSWSSLAPSSEKKYWFFGGKKTRRAKKTRRTKKSKTQKRH